MQMDIVLSGVVLISLGCHPTFMRLPLAGSGPLHLYGAVKEPAVRRPV